MKRITLLFSFVFISLIAFGQSVNYSPEELQKLQHEREQIMQEELKASGDMPVHPLLKLSHSAKPGQSPVYPDYVKEGEWIKYWETGINENALGLNEAGPWLAAIRWMPADLADYEGYAVSKINIYMNDAPNGATAMIWQGDIDDLTLVASQEMGVASEDWVLVELAEPYMIDTSQELWIGWEIDDPGAGIFPAAFEEVAGLEGFADLLSLDDGVWDFASDFGFNVIWNIEAFVEMAAEDDAPGAPQDFMVEAGAMGALEATLTWDNPALNFAGDPLTSLDEVHVFRGGELIHTITDPVIGGSETYVDTDIDASGTYNYMVMGVNALGDGPGASASAFIGEDVPAAPGNVILMADGNDGHITWDAPTEGLNGGYLSGDNLTYTVVRMPEETVVAEDIEATEFLDTTVPGIGNYFYTVTASNHIGEGGTAASNVELLAAEGILMYEVFDYPIGELPPGWVIDGVPHAWGVINSSAAGGEAPELRMNWSPAAVGMSRLITYPINVEGYSELRFKFNQYLNNFSTNEGEIAAIDVTFDGGDTWEAIWEILVEDNVPAGEYELFFDVPAGVTEMHFAFRFDGDSYNINQWFFDNMILEPVVENDLVGVSVAGNTTPSEGMETVYTITIQNAGTATQSDYTVKLMKEGGVEIASIAGDPIEFAETQTYELSWTPGEVENTFLYGYVDLAGDEATGNNQTPNLNVSVQSAEMVVVTIGTGDAFPTVRIPFDFFWKNSLAQTLYYPEEIGLGGGVITGLQYFNDFATDLPAKEVNIWMGETDMDDLSGGWVDPETLQLVYSGTIDFPIGVNDIFIPLDDIYVYGGGNLVVYTHRVWEDQYFSSLDRFYGSEDSGSARTRRASADGTEYDPAVPPAGSTNDWHPNTQLFFSTAGLGALEGTVTEDGEPLAGVNVHIDGTNSNATTDENGFFEFPYVLPGTYDLHFTKFGYYDAMLEDVVVEEEETTVVTTEMEAFPTVTVTGHVVGSDFPEVGIADAVVTLVGYDDYEAVTDADGNFEIEGVYADNDYALAVMAAGYDTYTDVAEVGTVDLDLGTIIVMEIASPVSGVVAEETDDGALVSWDSPGSGVLVELYQHDGEIPANPNAFFQTDDMVYGTIFDLSEYPDASVSFIDFHHLQWGIPNDNYDFLVHIVDWENFEVLTTVGPLTTEVNDDWELEVPLGHYSVAGYEQVGILIQPQGYIPSDAYPCITTDATGPEGLSISAPADDLSAFVVNGPTVGDFFIDLWITTGFAKDGIVKAEGLTSTNLDAVQTRTGEAIPSASATLTQMANVVEIEEKALESYWVFRLMDGEEGDMDDWTTIATQIPDTFHLDTEWDDLAQGLWKYAVIAEYTNENLSEPAFSNILPKDMTVPFTVNVSTNSGDLPTGAMVHLINMDEPQYEYEAVVPPTGVVDFLGVWRGYYAMTIELEGFDTYYVEDIDITEAASYDAELVETIVAPYALNVETFGLPLGDALLTWNTAEEVEFRYDDGVVDAQLGFQGTLNSVMGAAHYRHAELQEISWFLTDEGGPYATVKVWVLGLTDAGLPDRDNIIYTAENVPNVHSQWNTYELSETLVLPDGFFIGVSANGFLGLGLDDGVGEPWDFMPNTQFGVFDITDPTGEWLEIGGAGFPQNFLLRGFGLDFGPVEKGSGPRIAKRNADTTGAELLTGAPLSSPIDAGSPEYTSAGSLTEKAFLGFNVFLDGSEVANEISETEYMFTGLEDGMYEAGVQAVYTTGTSEIVTEEFFIGEVLHPVTFNVDMTDVEGFDPEEHEVYLTGTFTDWAEPGSEGSIVMEQAAGPGDVLFYENFDGYDDFTTDLSPWTTIQLTEGDTWGWADTEFPNEGEEWAWIAFNPSESVPPIDGDHPTIDGDKYGVAIQYMGENDDKWLISPEVTLDEASTLSFWARSLTAAYGLERIRVLVSTTGADPDDFEAISTEPYIEVPVDWTEYSYDLSDYADETIRFAINYVSFDAFVFMIDALKIEGAADAAKESLHYMATVMVPEGNHEYKYFSDAFGEGWDGGEWEGDPNREISVTGEMEVFDIWGGDVPDPDPVVSLPYFEDFTGIEAGELPEYWQATHANWAVNNSNDAGGESAPELRFHWSPSGEGTFRAITPLIDATEVDAIDLTFMHSVNDYSGDYTLMVQTSLDGETWDTQFELYIEPGKDVPADREVSFRGDIDPTEMLISLAGVAGEEFHIAFVYDGNSFNINQWYIDDIHVAESVYTASLPFAEDFTGAEVGAMPEHWMATDANWAVNNSNDAGGESAPELRFNWSPSAEGTFRAITPLINASTVDELFLTFMHSVNDYSGDYTLMIQTSPDGETWDTQWELYIEENKNVPADRSASTKEDIDPTEMMLDLSDLAGEHFHIAFVYEGNSFNINQWYIDDIFLNDESEIVSYTVTFDVVDVDGFPIDHAVITFGDVENEPGDYVFHDVPGGMHTYHATAVCFHEDTDEMMVDGDMEHQIMLELNIMAGDANGDGTVNLLDVIMIANYFAGNVADNFCFHNGDVNSDGIVNILDVLGTINIYAGGKTAPHIGLESNPANLFLTADGIAIDSDGTLAGIQFEITNVAGMELKLDLEGFELIQVNEDGTLRAMIFSMDNTPIPAGKMSLVSFSHEVETGWNSAVAGNLNAVEVPVVLNNDEVTGITDTEDISFNAYPNPASDMLYVEFNNTSQARLSLINVHGQVVETQFVNDLGSQQVSFDLGSLNSGIYMLRLDVNDNFIIERIMVK